MDTTATITLSGASFSGMGTITIGSGVDGNATFDDCDVLADTADSWDLDGSSFSNPFGDACLEMG